MENQLSFFQIRSVIHSNSLFLRSRNDMQNTTDNRKRLKIMRVLCPLIKWKIVIEICIVFERERIKVSKYSQHYRETLGSVKISVLVILQWAFPESYFKDNQDDGKKNNFFPTTSKWCQTRSHKPLRNYLLELWWIRKSIVGFSVQGDSFEMLDWCLLPIGDASSIDAGHSRILLPCRCAGRSWGSMHRALLVSLSVSSAQWSIGIFSFVLFDSLGKEISDKTAQAYNFD